MSARVTSQARISLLAWLATVLASISMFPLFDDKDYVVTGAVTAFVVSAVGIGLRALRVPAVLVVLGQLAALVEWLVLTRASEQAAYAVVPTPDAMYRIVELLRSGAETAAMYIAPVPADQGLTLLVAVGIAGVAILVDAIAVGLRHVAWAGLPLLALYTVPVATVPGGVPALAFLPGALGFVALLSAEERERVSHWGKQITRVGQLWGADSAPERVSTATLAQTGRRIGVTSVALAIALPTLLPAFPEHLFSSGGGLGGDGPIAISNPMVDLKRDLVRGPDTDVVQVRTEDGDPSYLRLTALDEFSGETWQPSVRDIPPDQQASTGMPQPPGLHSSVARATRRYSLSVGSDFESLWLPEYYPAVSVRIDGDWRYDMSNLDILSAEDDVTTAGIEYELDSLEVNPSAQQLQNAPLAAADVQRFYTELPADLPADVRQQAELITASARTDFERAVALQDWFRTTGGFTYSYDRPEGNSDDVLLDFLTTDRVGYCEQFAAAMALLARSLDIPARVAVGFLRPEQVGPGSFVFSTHDLHTWPELYFEGVGWVRFEPTPAARAEEVPSYTSGVAVDGPNDIGGSELPNLGRQDSEGLNRPGAAIPQQEPRQQAAPRAAGDSRGIAWLPVAVALLATLLVPALVRSVRRWRRWRRAGSSTELAEAAWAELRDTARDLGTGWAGWLTPRGTARALQPHLGGNVAAEQALARLVTFIERARYARTAGSHPDAGRDVATVTTALRSGVGRATRWRAALVPASLLPNLSAWWEGATLGMRPARQDIGPSPS